MHAIDVIIPVLNEEKILREKKDYYTWLKTRARVIFVDGGSLDETVAVARNYGEVIVSRGGRPFQMNQGAAACQSPNILFLHADTFVTEDALGQIERALKNGICGGCLTMVIEDPRWIFRIFEKIVNFRARRFKIIDGDLGLFVKKEVFIRLDQFAEVPVMEDILFSRKLKKVGKVAVLPGKIFVSGRKWHEKGFVKTFGQYALAYLKLWMEK